MSQSDEFKAQFKAGYGINMGRRGPDYARCAKEVHGGFGFSSWSQCSRKNGHGPHGAWCRQHDPVFVAKKNSERNAAYEAEYSAAQKKREFSSGCQTAIRQIAAGHDDPRGLAQSLIDKLEAKP